MDRQKVAIIGAGIAGVSAGLTLRAAGVEVRLFDKGRSPGGRISTRRVTIADAAGRDQALLFDHGAQFIRARTPNLLNWLKRHADDAVRHWTVESEQEDDGVCFIGRQGMSALPRKLAEGLEVETGCLVSAIHRQPDQWRLEFDDNGVRRLSGPFDIIIIAIPGPQAAALVKPVCDGAHKLAISATYSPCWAGLFAAPAGVFGDIRSGPVECDPVIGWIGRRRDRHPEAANSGDMDCVVVHATADWSHAHLEKDASEIASMLRKHLIAHANISMTPAYEAAHRWRYAFADQPVAKSCLWYDDLALGLCGDWLLGPTIESAWMSGERLARTILEK